MILKRTSAWLPAKSKALFANWILWNSKATRFGKFLTTWTGVDGCSPGKLYSSYILHDSGCSTVSDSLKIFFLKRQSHDTIEKDRTVAQ